MTDQLNGRDGHVYVVSAARTPIGKFAGALASTPAVELGGVAIRAAVERAGLPAGSRYGLATLCLGGGGSVAAAFERVVA